MASSVIGALRVNLGIDTANFSEGLKKAQLSMGRLEKSMAGVGATLRTSFAGFALGAASAISFSAAITGAKEALDAFGAIADKAKSAGIGTDLFQSITTLAGQSGVAIDQVSSALDTFAKNVGLAAVGKGKLVSQLQALNPELLRNLQLTTDQEERLRLAADAIAAAGSASQKAALSTALFGDAGAKMAGVFAGGAAALDAWTVKARDMGLIIDRDLIAKADDLGDSFDTAAQALDNQLKTAFINIAPLMVDAARLAADVAAGIYKIVDAGRELGNRSREGLERERDDLMQLLAGATSLGDMNANPMAVGLPPEQFEAMKAQLAEIDAELRGRAIDDLRVRLTELPKMVEDVPDISPGTSKAISALDQLRKATDVAAIGFTGLGKSATDAAEMSASAIAGSVAGISATLAGAFKENKAMALANTVISTAAGMMKAFEQGGLLGFAGAASIAAAGAAQIAAINSASPGGASMAPMVEAGGTAAAPASPAGQGLSLTIVGTPDSMVRAGSIAELVERINEYYGVNGQQLVVNYKQA